MFGWIASKFAPKKNASSGRKPAFQVEESDLDLRGVIFGVGEAGVIAEQEIFDLVRDEGILRADGFEDPEFEPAFLFVIGTAEDLLQDSEKAAIWRNRAWCHFALVLDKKFDLNDSDLKDLAERYYSVIPLIGAGSGSVIDAAATIVHANLAAIIRKGIVCVDYSDMATVLKYMGGILYSRVVDYLPPQNYGEVMVEELAKGREVELLPIATGVVVTCLADIRFSMGDFDDYGNALRELINEDATTIMAGPHGIHEPTEESPGRSVLLISFVPHDRERYVEDRGY
jgi:hypothetical protein